MMEWEYRKAYRMACRWNARLLALCWLLLIAAIWLGVLWLDAESMLQQHSPTQPGRVFDVGDQYPEDRKQVRT